MYHIQMLEIEKIIVKFINDEANGPELEKLDNWLNDDKHKETFCNYARIEYLTKIYMSSYDLENAKKVIGQKVIRTKKKQKTNLYLKIAAAASIVFIIGLSFFLDMNTQPENKLVLKEPARINIGSDKAILTLANGDEVALEKGRKFEKGSTKSNGEKLVYQTVKHQDVDVNKIAFNYLTIPRGGQFSVELSDGTKVWLNSESKLKYPTSFATGVARKIELVYGEAYMEVSPSSEHHGASFRVLTGSQEIEVLGTEFNIKAYKEDIEIKTTLAGGKILISTGGLQKILMPDQQATIGQNSKDIVVSKVDAAKEISWVKGLFTFDEKPLIEIMKVLSRWYDLEVVFESAERKKFIFTGILERAASAEDILQLIESTSENEVKFEIKDKTILIK